MALERFSAAWREHYVASVSASLNAGDLGECVFCVLAEQPVSESTGVLVAHRAELRRAERLPLRVGPPARAAASPRRVELRELSDAEYEDFFLAVALDGRGARDGLRPRRAERRA